MLACWQILIFKLLIPFFGISFQRGHIRENNWKFQAVPGEKVHCCFSHDTDHRFQRNFIPHD